MRRVIDDEVYELMTERIQCTIENITTEDIGQERQDGIYPQLSALKDLIVRATPNLKLGRDIDSSGYSNHHCFEMIYTGNTKEQQIFGLLRTIENNFGQLGVSLSDYDEERTTETFIYKPKSTS